MTQSYHFWVIYLKNSKSIYIEIVAHSCVLGVNSQSPSNGTSLDIHKEMNGKRMDKENPEQVHSEILFSHRDT